MKSDPDTRPPNSGGATLGESDDRYRSLFENAAVGMAMVGLDGRWLDVNNRLCEIFGRSREELLATTFQALTHPDDLSIDNGYAERLVAGEIRSYSMDKRYLGADRKTIWIGLTVGLHRDQSGTPLHFISVVRDIGPRKAAETALTETAERLNLALQGAEIGSFEWNMETGVNTWTCELEAIYGLPPGGFPGTLEAWERLVHPDDRASAIATVNEAVATGDPVRGEWRTVWPDGSIHWIAARFQTVKNAAGMPVRLTGVNLDITNRKETEQKLAESEMRFRSLFDQSAGFLAILSPDGTLLESNELSYSATGWTREETIGRKFWDTAWWCGSPDVQDVLKADLALALRGDIVRRETAYLTSSEALVVDRTLAPIRDASGKIVWVVFEGRDVTGKKRVEAALSKQRFRLRHAARVAGLTYSVTDLARGRLQAAENHAEVLGFPLPCAPDDIATQDAFALLLAHVVEEDRAAFTAASNVWSADLENPHIYEFRLRGDDGIVRWIERRQVVERDGAGRPAQIISIALDISARKSQEEHLKLLMREVNHRSKNLLAVVQSIARQTARHAKPQEFIATLSDRLQGLAGSQDLFIAHDWKGVLVGELARAQLDHIVSGHRIVLNGPQLMLTPVAAQGIGLALHELATNAIKYGALSNAAGTIALAWSIVTGPADSAGAGKHRFSMTWREMGGPPVAQPRQQGFGQTVIERMASNAIDANVQLNFAPAGLIWELDAPAEGVLVNFVPAPNDTAAET